MENETKFEEIALTITGSKRSYFSKEVKDLRDGRHIRGQNLFVETNLSANNAVSLVSHIAKAFGYGEISIECY
jgi:hypothetical protein